MVGHSQNHLAVAGGCAAFGSELFDFVPTRYREVVLTVSNQVVMQFQSKCPINFSLSRKPTS